MAKQVVTDLQNIAIKDILVDHKLNSRLLRDSKGQSYEGKKSGDDDTSIATLAAAIKKNGLAPIEVVENAKGPKKFSLVSGFRRMEAITSVLGWAADTLIPAVVKPAEIATDSTARTVANLLENVQRKGLSPAELGNTFAKLEATGIKAASIAARVGLSASYVTNLIRLKKTLSPKIWKEFEAGVSKATQAYLLSLSTMTHAEQEENFYQVKTSEPDSEGSGDEGKGTDKKPGAKRPPLSDLALALQVAREEMKAMGEGGDLAVRARLSGIVTALIWAVGESAIPPVTLPAKGKGKSKAKDSDED